MRETPQNTLRDDLIRRGLRLPQLRLLVALEDTGQVSAAAAQVAMSQPAASRILSELEKTVGSKLCTRHAKGVSLTPAGRALAVRGRDVLRRLDQAGDEIAALNSGTRGPVRIGAVTGAAVEMVLPVIRELRVTYPDIELSVLVDTSDKLGEALLARDLDFYIGRVPLGLDPRLLTLEEIGPEPVSLIARQDHPLTRVERPVIADCLAFDWVMQDEGGLLRRTSEDYLLRNGFRPPERILSTSSLLLTLAIICETNALAPIARAAADFYASPTAFGGRIRRLDLAEEMEVVSYSLIRLRDHEAPPTVDRVHNMIRRKIAQLDRSGG
ncbi:LysR family transcriptional regulator [Pseudooceanicola sp. C21-150M6]|uniref:LysR family transcriptional regulator n=1 Tax=Pseudooceanicola sp. C21-150M6 TaxID=3434355 RepID=UPI003D7F9C61